MPEIESQDHGSRGKVNAKPCMLHDYSYIPLDGPDLTRPDKVRGLGPVGPV